MVADTVNPRSRCRRSGRTGFHVETRRGLLTASAVLLGLSTLSCGSDSTPAQADAGTAVDAAPPDGTAGDAAATDTAPADGPRGPSLPEDPPTPLPTGDPAVRLGTFNTALSATVRGPAERLPHIIAAITAADLDLLCLQEVYALVTTREELADAVASTFPYAYWQDHGTTTLGSGTMILSKHPLYRGRGLRFQENRTTGMSDFDVIGADVLMASSYFSLLCTHLISGLEAEGCTKRTAEVEELVVWAGNEGYLTGPTFLLGDFNCGPDPMQSCTTCLTPDETTYELVQETFTDANEGWTQCTQCRDVFLPLQLTPTFEDEPDQRIDHCFYREIGAATPQSRALIFDEEQSIALGTDTLTSLSDHLGVRCVFGL